MIHIVGLGPSGLDRVPARNLELLLDPDRRVIVRTLQHPAAAELADRRTVESCDDLYESLEDFETVYAAIVDRVVSVAPVVYAVPGSPTVGERAVTHLSELSDVEILGAESFLDLALSAAAIDPLAEGLTVLDARDLPFPLLLDGPVVVGQVDHPLVAGDLKVRLLDQLDPETEVIVMRDLGGSAESVTRMPLADLDRVEVGVRTSIAFRPEDAGWPGLVKVVARLRRECPWDREQTHQSLVRYLVEESYEVIDAIGRLPADPTAALDPADLVALEDELGDVLLQVLLHSAIASESAGFTIDDVAEQQRAKLVRRHPHVFGGVNAETAAEVEANWAARKAAESDRHSAMDGVPAMPPLARADKVQRRAAKSGFDWAEVAPVFAKVVEELGEVQRAAEEDQAAEIGDLLFAVVNLARHLQVDSELALSSAVDKFVRRFRAVEAMGPMEGVDLSELDARWEQVKGRENQA